MKRIVSIDAMRGFAMVLVITQHAFHLVNLELAQSSLGVVIYGITRMASVAFMVVSGAMLGFFAISSSDHKRLRLRYFKRAALVLIAGHVMIPLVRFFYYKPDPLGRFFHNLATDYPITDTIAFCLVLGLLIIIRFHPRVRVLLAVGLLVLTPIVQLLWGPGDVAAATVKEVLFGASFQVPAISVPWPLIPWLGIFLIGSIGGEAIARIRSNPESVEIRSRQFFQIAISLFALGTVLSICYKLLRVYGSEIIPGDVFSVIYPSRTTLLLPAYLGILLAAQALVLRVVKVRGGSFLPVWLLTVFGRTSLFTYITQFIFVHTLPAIAGLKGNLSLTGYLLLLAASLPASWLTSYLFGRVRGKIKRGDRLKYQTSSL